MSRFISLPHRLRVIAGYIKSGTAVVDVGSDHGLLPVFLAQSGGFRRLIASDISSGSLQSARRNAAKYGVADKVEFMIADGLMGLSLGDVDTIIISGLGGETIRDILQDAPWTKSSGICLILQPQSKIDVLCNFLYNNGYLIRETQIVRDRGRQYTLVWVGW
ncbi:MAG: class I SAM-dependent methyltransferase [Oscillospiraceae bacterium]|nr:class I SAM-dependent methyltransferase [Oscillospiraceae bacterium]